LRRVQATRIMTIANAAIALIPTILRRIRNPVRNDVPFVFAALQWPEAGAVPLLNLCQ
jgi:hypothetical protein